MPDRFEILILNDARKFLKSLDKEVSTKIIRNMQKSRSLLDVTFLKKLTAYVWEFRTQHEGINYRLLAFWDKTDKQRTLVVATNGFVKKQNRVSEREIAKALNIRQKYFDDKKSNK
jgi:phage-related protein